MISRLEVAKGKQVAGSGDYVKIFRYALPTPEDESANVERAMMFEGEVTLDVDR